MGRGQSGLWATSNPFFECEEACEAAEDSRYTQESTSSDYVRSNEELADDQIRQPRLSEGVSFREKI
jgi:hypothetical protein